MDHLLSDRARLPIAVLGLLAICLVSTAVSVRRASKPDSPFLPTNGFAESLRQMHSSLPARGVIGYVDGGQNTPAEVQDYYIAQYAVAPLVLTHSSNEPIVIANFSRTRSTPPDGLVEVLDLGNGIGLFESRSTLLATRSH